MLFAIDFDGTYAADPAVFARLRALLEDAGHRCVLVTGRSDEGRWGEEVRATVGDLPIVFAAGGWKRAAAEAAGLQVDVWIDDAPEYVGPQTDREAVAFKERMNRA